jgi:3',5'-cyclic AMP phosphodiesterase CpdA
MSEIRYLFRFRDLVASTIEEHQRVIKEQGACWWGWWKRPSEDSRSDIWNELEKITSTGESVEVGLFDSGGGKIYRAKVTGVVRPTESSAENTIKLLGDELKLVPPYYRDSPFSRAWMKITEIEGEPIEFFGLFSFAEAPKLPNYAGTTLDRFKGKRISGAEELRGMDTTIWRIRSSLPTDSSEQILLTVQAISEPISAEVISCKSDKILHLTDIHFAAGKNREQHVWRYDSELESARPTMVHAVTSELNDKKIGLVIISGDFTFIGSDEEFEEARTSISHLLGILDLSTDHLILVPGNHDIQWTTNEVYDHNAIVVEAPPRAKSNYEKFYRALMRHDPSKHLAMGRRFAVPCGITLEVCALNSSSLETGSHFLAGMGRIEEGAFADVAKGIGWGASRTLALRLLVIHHHLALTEDLEAADGYGKGYGLAVDAVRIQRLAARKGVHLALHGHKHRSFIWRSTIYELPEHTQTQYRLGELSIIGGGSVGSRETDGFSNYFNIISLDTGVVRLEIFRSMNRGSFGLIQEWSAQLSIEGGEGLRLGEWEKVR